MWKILDDAREVREYPGGILAIRPRLCLTEPIPFNCPNCGFLNSEFDDVITMKSHSCCSFCYIHWVEPNRDRWESGWRPTPTDVFSMCERFGRR
jgi:hypothetical protein